MERSPDFEAAGVSFETRMRMFNPKKETVTSIQFFAPAKVRYFTQYPGVSPTSHTIYSHVSIST